MKSLKFYFSLLLLGTLLLTSCEEIPDIDDREIPFQQHTKTLQFTQPASRSVQFEDFSYRPYIRVVKPSCSKTEMLKVLFLKKDNHNISKVTFNRKVNGKHYGLKIYVEEASVDSTSVGESAVEMKFTLEKFADMKSFFERKKTAYFEVEIVNLSKNNAHLGYMILSNDYNGGTFDPPPFVDNNVICE